MRRQVAVLSVVSGILAMLVAMPQASARSCAPAPGGVDTMAPVTSLVGSANPVATDTRIRLTRWSTKVRYGDFAVMHGQVVSDDGAIPDATVDLYTRQAGASEWVAAGSAQADQETGVFAFGCLLPEMNTDYRVVYEGSLTHAASQLEHTVRVLRRVPDTLSQVAADRFRLRGSVQPGYADRRVLLQQKDCRRCRWDTVRRKETTSRSRWRFTIDADWSGRRWFRAVVPADRSYARSPGDHVWRITS